MNGTASQTGSVAFRASAADDTQLLLVPGLRPPVEPTTLPSPHRTRRVLARIARSSFVRRDLRAAADAALTTAGVFAVAAVVLAVLLATRPLGVLLLAASQGGLQ